MKMMDEEIGRAKLFLYLSNVRWMNADAMCLTANV